MAESRPEVGGVTDSLVIPAVFRRIIAGWERVRRGDWIQQFQKAFPHKFIKYGGQRDSESGKGPRLASLSVWLVADRINPKWAIGVVVVVVIAVAGPYVHVLTPGCYIRLLKIPDFMASRLRTQPHTNRRKWGYSGLSCTLQTLAANS